MTDSSSQNDTPDQLEWPDQVASHKLMKIVLEHYQTHHEIVLKKLHHAQEATSLSVKEQEPEQKEEQILAEYDAAWQTIITLFQTCGITQEELFEIEKVLQTLPENIRRHFERLLTMDKLLQTLIENLKKLDYDSAMQQINKIQNRPNPMSGLDRKEYEKNPEQSTETVKVFSILPNLISNND